MKMESYMLGRGRINTPSLPTKIFQSMCASQQSHKIQIPP